MDLVLLQTKIKKDPKNYFPEYLKTLNLYRSLLKLPKIPKKQVFPIISFLTNTTKYYLNDTILNDYKYLLFTHLDLAKEKKDVLLNNVLALKNQGVVGVYDYFSVLIRYGQRFKPISSRCEDELIRLSKNSKSGNKEKFRSSNIKNECSEDAGTKNDIKNNSNNNQTDKFNNCKCTDTNFCHTNQSDTIENIASLFHKYLKIGNERQRLFSIHMLIFLYERGLIDLKDVLIENLFSGDKIGKFILFYFLKNVNDDGEFINKRGDIIKIKVDKTYKDLNKDMGRKKAEENNNDNIEDDISDEESTSGDELHLDELLEILPRIYSDLKKKEAKKLARKLFEEVKQKLDDRLMRLKKLKIISLLRKIHKLELDLCTYIIRLIDPSRNDLKMVVNILLESMTQDDVKSVVARIVDMFCSEYRDDDFIVYGLNILKEIVLRFKIDVRDRIKAFRHSKVKSVFYAYSMVMRAVKYGTCDKRDVDYIKMRGKSRKKKISL